MIIYGNYIWFGQARTPGYFLCINARVELGKYKIRTAVLAGRKEVQWEKRTADRKK